MYVLYEYIIVIPKNYYTHSISMHILLLFSEIKERFGKKQVDEK